MMSQCHIWVNLDLKTKCQKCDRVKSIIIFYIHGDFASLFTKNVSFAFLVDMGSLIIILQFSSF